VSGENDPGLAIERKNRKRRRKNPSRKTDLKSRILKPRNRLGRR
jgi:hypothetical protein